MQRTVITMPVPAIGTIALFVLVWAVFFAPVTFALDPTELEPAEAMEGKTFELEQEVSFRDYSDSEVESETSLEYEFNQRSALKLTVPIEWEEDEDTEVDVGLRYKLVFNPNADRAPILAASIEAIVPDDGGVDGELGIYLSKRVGGAGEHQLHLNLLGYYDNDAESDERDFRYMAIVGYSCQVTTKTSLVVDVEREQLEDSSENAIIVELGVKHEFNDTVAVALGVGAGIGEESPDFTARAGISFRFGPNRK